MRNVIFSHNMFKEGLEAFHPIKGKEIYNQIPIPINNDDQLYGYILLDFKLKNKWDFGDFVIEESIEINQHCGDDSQVSVKSFVSPVKMPKWVSSHNGHLFLLGLSTFCSFGIERSILSPQNSFMIKALKAQPLSNLMKKANVDEALVRGAKLIINTECKQEIPAEIKAYYKLSEKNNYLIVKTTKIPEDLAIRLNSDGAVVGIDNNCKYKIKDILYNWHDIYSDIFKEFSLTSTVIVRGPGSELQNVHADILDEWGFRLKGLYRLIKSLPYEAGPKDIDYKKTMQAFRLIHLAHINHDNDFDLAYSLLVAGVEAVSQIAIPLKKSKHELHTTWKELAKENPDIKILFNKYGKMNSNDKKLSDRFADFILKYAPVSEWEVLDKDEIRLGFDNKYKFEFEGIRRRTEIKPSSFSDVYLRDEVIKRTYAYRSSFIHVGGNLPHREVEGSPLNRFLEEVYEPKKHKTFLEKLKKENRNEYSRKEALEFTNFLITYALMRTIARKSIFNYLEECTG